MFDIDYKLSSIVCQLFTAVISHTNTRENIISLHEEDTNGAMIAMNHNMKRKKC